MATTPNWVIVTDFDGTLTTLDVGNELAKEALGRPRFDELQAAYRSGKMGLKEMQRLTWEKFPMPLARFKERSLHYARLRPGVNEFLERCVDAGLPVYVASCGVRPYIETVLDALLTPKARASVRGIECNGADFDASGISRFIPPATAADCPYPLDKGDWARKVAKAYPGAKLLGIGNGTSDRSFHGHVDTLACTEALATWASKEGIDYIPFEDFEGLMKALPLWT
jgi:2-hydroxy-3-keto-5-methylthiopentenyl-1-phosphate phosphatase